MPSYIRSLGATVVFVASLLVSSLTWADSAYVPSQLLYTKANTVAGNPNGKITVVEFFDYNCGYCKHVPAILHKLISSNPSVRVVYRDYPVLGPDSMYSARVALAAGQQGKYLEMNRALFSKRERLSESYVTRLASNLGIDFNRLKQDISSRSVDRQIQINVRQAENLGLSGVPVLLVAATPSDKTKPVKAIVLTAPSYQELQSAVSALS